MAPLVNLVNRVLWAIEEPQSLNDLIRAIVEVAEGFKHQLRQHALHVAESALALISDGITIVTLSYSTTVHHALRHAQRAGRRFRVVCGESRPILEGRQTAAILAEYGIPTQLAIDAELPAHIAQAQLVLVGADMLSTQGLVNKVGTYGMALTAHAKGVGILRALWQREVRPARFSSPPRTTRPPPQRDLGGSAAPCAYSQSLFRPDTARTAVGHCDRTRDLAGCRH
jgi:translation initiation factor eIF-2B subunit delta